MAAIAGENPHVPPSGVRVRGQNPMPGDAQGPGTAPGYRAFVVIRTLGLPPHPQVPIQRARHAVQCYGRSPQEAEALYAACFAALHARGPRVTGAGDGIYVTHDDTGGSYSTDPVTGQPLYSFVVETLATTQAVAQ